VVEAVLTVLGGCAEVLLCILEALDGRLCLLEVPEVMHCVLLCMLEVVESELCLLEMLLLCISCYLIFVPLGSLGEGLAGGLRYL
jgi:hypothetical protein